MVKKSIKYTDFNGNEQVDECYFNLSQSELTQLEVSEKGGFENYISRMIAEQDNKKIYALFKEIVLMSYGEKSFDGKSFIKKKMIDGQLVNLRDQFEQTMAFDTLMMELISGGEKTVAEFINKLIPNELQEEIAKQTAEGKIKPPKA